MSEPQYDGDDMNKMQEFDEGRYVTIPRAQHEALMAAVKLLPRMHKAADILMAWLISKDDKFLPSKSTVWPNVVALHEAIKALRAAGILEGE